MYLLSESCRAGGSFLYAEAQEKKKSIENMYFLLHFIMFSHILKTEKKKVSCVSS